MADKDSVGEFMAELAERQGVACATVSDGHVLLFKVDYLRKMLDKNIGRDKLVIFVKRPMKD